MNNKEQIAIQNMYTAQASKKPVVTEAPTLDQALTELDKPRRGRPPKAVDDAANN